MEENKVATDSELRERAEKLAKRLGREIGTGKAIGIIFRELVAVRDQTREAERDIAAENAAGESL